MILTTQAGCAEFQSGSTAVEDISQEYVQIAKFQKSSANGASS
jgi:hypothetical protein